MTPEALPRHGVTPEALPRHGVTPEVLPRHGVTPEVLPRHGVTPEALPRRGVTPETLTTLANLGLARRPASARTRVTEAALPDAATASRQLGALIAGPVTEADLPGLRDLQQAAAQAVDALLAGEVPDFAAINAVARGSTGRAELVVSGEELRERIVWDDGTAAAELARRLVRELAALDPSRLRRCGRRECDLAFYDTTRSRTRRWHAEDPCGWRERQHARRHPAVSSGQNCRRGLGGTFAPEFGASASPENRRSASPEGGGRERA